MRIGIPKEIVANETRAAATPNSVKKLLKLGFDVTVERGLGEKAGFTDDAYREAGAEVADRDTVWQSEIIYKINAPLDDEIEKLREGMTLVSFLSPRVDTQLTEKLAAKKINALAMDMVPRISRAQSLDALSSIANIGGYRAIIEAAHHFGRFFTGQVTAAGKVPPAKVLVIGAGVAGLAAIGTADSLGAVVRAFDTRLEVAEQIESTGGEFLRLKFEGEEDGSTESGYAKVMSDEFVRAEMELFAEQAKEVDIIVTTAQIPGKPAPKLITKEMVDSMRPGSVIVDMAASSGGNCEYTVPDEVFVTESGVKIVGYTNLSAGLPAQSSEMYSTNLVNLTKLLSKEKDGNICIDFDDVILRNMCVVKEGDVTFPPPPISVSAAPKQAAAEAPKAEEKPKKEKGMGTLKGILGICGAALFAVIALYAPQEFLGHFSVFILACIVGYYVVWNVTHALHTPLMSVTNAISGIIIVGVLLQISPVVDAITVMAFIGILLTSINIFGGFAVTHRMLKMFNKE